MMKQLVLPLVGVAAFIIVVGLLVKNSGHISIPGIVTPEPTATAAPLKTITVGGKSVQVEVADTDATRELGLGKRSSLIDNSGMVFMFGSKGVTPVFWMKDMLIPLDMIWISGSKVVKIDKNIPAPTPGTDDAHLKTYAPGQPIDYVLEVNAGFSDKNGIKVGNAVDLSSL